ncbi:MAG: serine/threonine-protein kinase [Gemmataceae bacterium]
MSTHPPDGSSPGTTSDSSGEQRRADDPSTPTVSFFAPQPGPLTGDNSPTMTRLGAESESESEPASAYDSNSPTVTSMGESAYPPTVDAKHDGTSPDMPALNRLPFIPGFDVIQEIGRGGMGVVYKARQYSLNRLTAIKMVIVERQPSAEELIRFRLEAEVAARIRHPNVVQLYESGAIANRPYLVMEWVEGGTLSDLLKRARLFPPLIATKIVSILARALHHVHSNGVVHRDLKPGNILLTRTETTTKSRTTQPSLQEQGSVTLTIDGKPVTVIPKVTDFGLAKLTVGEMGLTETGRIMGTPEFMSPEQAAGKIREIGPASDLHALGAMLYQLIVGHTPFRGDNTYAVIKKVIEDEPKSIRAVSQLSRVPSDIETVCMKCLRKNPADRYLTAAALADDLDAILAGRPISARPVGAVERFWKFTKRNPVTVSLAASMLLSLTGGFAGVTWQWQKTITERNRAIAAESEATRQQKTSEAVNRFLVEDLIAAAAPDRAQGRTVTVQDALDDAALRLSFAFKDQPAIDAGVRHAIGESYRKLGKPDLAEGLLRTAFTSRREILGSNHIDTLRTEMRLALALDDEGKWNEAESMLNDTVDRAVTHFGPRSDIALDARSAYGLSLQVHGKSDEARTILTDVLALRTEGSGPDHPGTMRAMNDLGLVEYERKNYPEAEKWISQALEARERILTRNHPDTLESINNLAAVHEAEGKIEEASKELEMLIERSRAVRGESHVDTLSAINNFGRLLYRQKQFAAAASRYQQAIDAAVKSPSLGSVHPITLKFRHNLGTALFGLRKFDQADATIESVYKLRKSILPPRHVDTLQAGHDLGTLRVLSNRPHEALSVLAATYADRKATDGVGHINTLMTANSWGKAVLQSAEGGPAQQDAITALKEVIAAAKEKTPSITALETLAKTLEARDKAEKEYQTQRQALADRPREQYEFSLKAANQFVQSNDMAAAITPALDAVAAAKKLPATEQPLFLRQSRLLAGQAALAASRFDRAESPLREEYTAIKSTSPQSFDCGVSANLLARCLTGLKKFTEAEPLALEGYETIRTNRKEGITVAEWVNRLSRAKDDIVTLYESQGQTEKAREWREKRAVPQTK